MYRHLNGDDGGKSDLQLLFNSGVIKETFEIKDWSGLQGRVALSVNISVF